LLRSLGKKRKVLDAIWDQQPVILKLFTSTAKAKYHAVREWRALKLLQERELNSPAPLFYGKTDQSDWAVVTEKIINAQNVRGVWDHIADAASKCDLLCKVARELARQHSKGVLQKDLHLGNFLLKGEEVLALDASQMCFLAREVNKKQAIAQLALLGSAWPQENTDTTTLCHEYGRARSWEFTQRDLNIFCNKLALARKNGIKRSLRKCLRTNKRHKKVKQRDYSAVATRDFFEKADFHKLTERIDQLMQSGKILKDGKTCFVARVNWAGEDVVVKRYNHKGIIHALRHTIKGTRARRSWLHAHRLETLNVATAKPLAFIEKRRKMLVWKSYFVTKYVHGQNLYDFMRNINVTEEERATVRQKALEVLNKLQKYRISHGDLKRSNILLSDKSLVLTDLDAMKAHRWKWTYKMRQVKDVRQAARFLDA
jgi:tRNA A-37 threonylcarbamoyl transferase component Bud32